jgi:hypothetical protein
MFAKRRVIKRKQKVVDRYWLDIQSRYTDNEICAPNSLIYVIGNKVLSKDQVGNFKVGRSTSETFENRIKSLQTGNPNDLTVYLVATVNNPKMESICHKELSKIGTGIKKQKGEWFYGSLTTIRSILFRAIETYDIRKELL